MAPHRSSLYAQLPRFLIIGAGALIIDIGGYELLNLYLNGLAAKALSFIAATQFAYACNKYWTFAKPERSGVEFLQFNTLYAATLGVNVAVHSALTNFTDTPSLLALLLASAGGTTLNFIGQRHWIFTRSNHHSP